MTGISTQFPDRRIPRPANPMIVYRAGWGPYCARDGQSFAGVAIGGWTSDKSKSGNPSRVPIFNCLATDSAFKAVDLTLLHNMLAAVINRAAFARSMHTFHCQNMRSNRADF